jgi:hypothetical protein
VNQPVVIYVNGTLYVTRDDGETFSNIMNPNRIIGFTAFESFEYFIGLSIDRWFQSQRGMI